MAQILANNTNAVSGTCPPGPPPPTALPPEVRECFSEFLPTADWIGFLSDRTMNFRLTARDGFPGAGGIGSASTKLTLAPLAGPFLVTSQAAPATLRAGTVQTVTWDVAGTAAAPVNTSEVKISLLSGEVLAAATPNDGSAEVTVPNVADQHARIKVEAVGNVFFDVSDADLVIQAAPDVVVTDKTVQYSDAVSGTVVEATDADSAGSALTATATGLPAGLSLADGTTSEHSRTWTLAGNVTAAPGTYTGSVTVTDGDGEAITKPLIVTVTPEDAVVTYLGDTLSSGKVLLRARLKDADDGAPGDIGKATVTFKRGLQDALHLAVLHGHAAQRDARDHRRGGRVLHRLRAGHRPRRQGHQEGQRDRLPQPPVDDLRDRQQVRRDRLRQGRPRVPDLGRRHRSRSASRATASAPRCGSRPTCGTTRRSCGRSASAAASRSRSR